MEQREYEKFLKWIFFAAVAFVVLFFGLYSFKFHGELSSDFEKWGAFGDFIGGTLNPILSFLALLALLLTIALQNKQLKISAEELKISREELQKTREELKRTAEAQEELVKAQAKQAKATWLSAKFSSLNYEKNLVDEEILRIGPSYMEGSPEEATLNALYKEKDRLEKEFRMSYEQLQDMDETLK